MSPIQAMIAREAAAETLASEFAEWLQSALPGEVCEYHRGHLGEDRDAATDRLGDTARWQLNARADLALAMEARGQVLLVQRRLEDGAFSYLAIKTRPRTAVRAHARRLANAGTEAVR